MSAEEFSNKLTGKGLKVTPQRIAILNAVVKLNNHPTAENIIDYIRKNNPNIAIATVYKVLDALVASGLIRKVKTENDKMRYDAMMESHHHLYCSESDRIADYSDPILNEMLARYFKKTTIANFIIEDIKLQIIGKFVNDPN